MILLLLFIYFFIYFLEKSSSAQGEPLQCDCSCVGLGGGAINHAIIIMPNDNRVWGKCLVMIMMMKTVYSVRECVHTPVCQNTLPKYMYAPVQLGVTM